MSDHIKPGLRVSRNDLNHSDVSDLKKTTSLSTTTYLTLFCLIAQIKLDHLVSYPPSINFKAKYPAAMKLTPARILYLCLVQKSLAFSRTLSNIIIITDRYRQIYNFRIEMIEFTKIFCDLHPNELISNYCAHQQCNVALCATCICSHTESHIQRRTAPDYENIRTTYSKMQDCLRTRISALQHQKSRINLVIENIHSKRKGITELIMQARHQTIDFVNKFYDAKEKEVLRKIEADQKKLGLHNQNRMQTLMNMLSRDVNSLFAAASDLNSQNFLQNFNRIRTQVLSNSLITKNEISEELDKNESYDVNLSINPIYINDIKNGLEKSINMIYDQKRNAGRMMERNENVKSNSRVVVSKDTSNQSSGVHIVKRASQSLPKPAIQVNHPSRYTSTIMEHVPYFVKQPAPQPKAQPHHQSFTINTPYITNNSLPVNMVRPNHQSRIEVRVNSSEKNIKENQKHPLSQSYMEPSLSSSTNHLSTPQLDNTKKIRKSGLTILRALENEKN